MEERSLKVLDSNKTFFGKLSNTFSKLLVPTKIGINGIVITLKRNNLLKSYDNFNKLSDSIDETKKENAKSKYEEAYTLYLEAIDKHIMDTVYKKVSNNTASEFEKDAMGQYYVITTLKNTDYVAYKFKKQKYLMELDFESLKSAEKKKAIEKYSDLYFSKMDTFYKGILKNYSVALAETTKKAQMDRNKVFYEVFGILNEYITKIMPLKIEKDKKSNEKFKEEYEIYENLLVGKLSEKEEFEKKFLLLKMSRAIFIHSLPLVALEKCYDKLIEDIRITLVTDLGNKRKEDLYLLLIDILKEYNEKLLSNKIYWENLDTKAKFKKFWDKYEKKTKEKDKEILLLKREISLIDTFENETMSKVVKYYKEKLLAYGAIRQIKNSYTTRGKYIKKNKKKRVV